MARLQQVWQIVFYAAPLVLMLLISVEPTAGTVAPGLFSLSKYAAAFSTPRYAAAIGNSLQLSLISAAATLGFALPLAYALHRHVAASARRYLLIALALPFFSSYVLRMYGWQAWVSDNGILVWLARSVFGIQDASGFLFSGVAATVGLVSVLISLATLIIYLSLARIDPTLVPAARNLGASAWNSFLKIELPFALPAILVSFLFCFLLAFGDFVCVTILGGNRIYYYSIAIQDQMKINDWPMAAALGTILLVMSLVFMAITFTLIGRTGVVKNQPSRVDRVV